VSSRASTRCGISQALHFNRERRRKKKKKKTSRGSVLFGVTYLQAGDDPRCRSSAQKYLVFRTVKGGPGPRRVCIHPVSGHNRPEQKSASIPISRLAYVDPSVRAGLFFLGKLDDRDLSMRRKNGCFKRSGKVTPTPLYSCFHSVSTTTQHVLRIRK